MSFLFVLMGALAVSVGAGVVVYVETRREKPEPPEPEHASRLNLIKVEKGLVSKPYTPAVVAEFVREQLEPVTKCVMIVGSVRRGKAAPGDADLLVIPRKGNDFMTTVEALADNDDTIRKESGGAWRLDVLGIPVHIIPTTEEYWGVHAIQYTGSRRFHERFLNRVRRRDVQITSSGMPVRSVSDGYGAWQEPFFAGMSEAKILTYLGLEEYADPATREEA